jgi:hypothetical protein
MGALQWIARGAGGLLLLAAGAAGWDMATYDAKAWSADFERLKRDMAQGYANLDHVAGTRRIDLRRLSEETGAEIEQAGSRLRAYRAIKRFAAAFGDPHVSFEARSPAPPGAAAQAAGPPKSPPVVDCGAAGYEEAEHGFRFPWQTAPGWRDIAHGNFPSGMIGNTGVLRIAEFSESRYLSACRAAFRTGLDERALQLATRAVLQGELKARIASLKAQGAERLLVDISANGGGSEWVQEAIALFTGRTLSRRAALMAAPRCDRSGIWRGERVCPVLAAQEESATIAGTGDWRGPVLMLIDGGTASASEDFVAWLKENGVAKVLGARTYGAGCGYVDGGTVTRFRAMPYQVKMPNCARFLRSGENEIDGIPPDIALPMDKPDQAAAALARLLAKR